MTEDRKPPYFHFYPRDFVSDPVVASMTAEERGGYITLLCFAWMRDEPGVVPDDDGILARLSQLGDRWMACRDAIRRAFTVSKGRLVQKRMRSEAEVSARYIAMQMKRGRLGAYARWANHMNGTSNATAMQQALPEASTKQWPHDSRTEAVAVAETEAEAEAVPESEAGKSKALSSVRTSARPPRALPTLNEVRAYCAERTAAGRHPVDPEAWFDHYSANGWKVGKNPMRDWKAAVRTWERNGFHVPMGTQVARTNLGPPPTPLPQLDAEQFAENASRAKGLVASLAKHVEV
jgi:uncharacterized protein YdaU (DUF1376 family)